MKTIKHFLYTILLVLATACTQHHGLIMPDRTGGTYGDVKPSPMPVRKSCPEADAYLPKNYSVNEPLITTANSELGELKNPIHPLLEEPPLSKGDMIELLIEDGEGFSGKYIINPDGNIYLPVVGKVKAQGNTVAQLARNVEHYLVRNEVFQPHTVNVDVRILDWAGIEVSVVGAVFNPGRVYINKKFQEGVISERLSAIGDNAKNRYASEAIRAASGIRPDARLQQIRLIRNGWQYEIDMSGIFTGKPVNDITLIAGDRLVVPSTGCFQAALVRPSEITPKGFRVFMSNLIEPAQNNSAANVGKYSTNLPYGSRLLQAVVSANCAGGIQLTNSPRKVVLAGTDPVTGNMQVIERSIDDLVRNAGSERVNPYLVPNDSLVCYDSDVTNLRDFARSLTDIFYPLKVIF